MRFISSIYTATITNLISTFKKKHKDKLDYLHIILSINSCLGVIPHIPKLF